MLGLRILSALVLAPIALAAAWVGSWAFVALAVLAAVLLGWEWTRLCQGRFGAGGVAISAFGALAAVFGHLQPLAGLVAALAGAVIAPLLQERPDRSPLWMITGALYAALPALAIVWVRESGRDTLIWLLLVVWATDIGAYAAGRSIGGPKLMPRVSPKKTWAGLAGGVAAAALVGATTAAVLAPAAPSAGGLAAISALLAVAAQAGDLAESWVKRYFGVKDSSGIIPGHGGVMDRLDGLLAVVPIVALLCLFFGGGLSLWR